jgi:PD-(D/E)XK endonuclease
VSGSKLRLPKPKLTNHPVNIGQRTEAAILAELVRRGYSVLLPFGTNQRYDLVLDLGGEFVRAQCKTGRLRGGSIEFTPRSVRANRTGVFSRSYRGEVEIFLVHCPKLNRIYAVPVEETPRSSMTLRLKPARNGQARRTHPAEKYELPG